MPVLSTQEHKRNRDLLRAFEMEAGPMLDRIEQQPADTAWKLLEGEVDMALASPLLFAQREGDLVIMPGACVAATGETGEVLLQFRKGLREISSVGYYGEPGIDTMLAEVILKEKYRMYPRFFPMKQEPGEALAAVDALLFPSHEERRPEGDASVIDMIDEWFDLTQLPFVREIFIGWEARMDSAIDDAVRRAGDSVDSDVLVALDEALQEHRLRTDVTSALPPHYRYRFTPDAQEGLQNFFQMAFFHGLRTDIPNFTFWAPEEEGEG
ncbi:hypothetical protein KQI65_03595 [bacterium]|nr:hypothetical protein [bacterium]